jgi:7 transmembrane helices usually fused to an inactive transglutaminase/Inactive transglutaminase fused to 7 transmembrane helices
MWRTLMTFMVAGIAIVLGLGVAYYKHSVLSFPLKPDTSINSWYVEMHTTLQSPERWRRRNSGDQEATVSIIAPNATQDYAVVDTQSIASRFGKQTSLENGRSVLHFTKRDPDDTESVYVRFMLYELDVNDTKPTNDASAEAAAKNNPYIKTKRLSNPDETTASVYDSVDMVLEEAIEKSSSPRSFAPELWKILKRDEGTRRYLQQSFSMADTASVMMILSQVAGYQARVANGLSLGENPERSAHLKRWLEIWHKDTWLMFDAETGEYLDPKARLYRWWVGTEHLVSAKYFKNFVTTVSVKPNVDSSLTRALWNAKEKQPLAYRYAAQTLPLDQQAVVQVLLLMPLGALIVAFMRQVIGVKTFGTFMPVLVALAFRQTGAQFGILFFMAIVFVGLLVRSYLDRLRLLMVPRLSAVLCVVVALMFAAMIGFKDSDIPLGVSIALFPVVIMTMFIERMSTMWDESGAKSAINACLGSLIIAWLIFWLITNPLVKHAMITFPELLLVVFGLCLMLGRYNGYKFTEYRRFRQLKRAIQKQQEDAAKANAAKE